MGRGGGGANGVALIPDQLPPPGSSSRSSRRKSHPLLRTNPSSKKGKAVVRKPELTTTSNVKAGGNNCGYTCIPRKLIPCSKSDSNKRHRHPNRDSTTSNNNSPKLTKDVITKVRNELQSNSGYNLFLCDEELELILKSVLKAIVI